jgi:NAD-dependent dihydropyrimidine dehydrogenase PreA subunit
MNGAEDRAALCAKVSMPDSIREFFDYLYTDFDRDILNSTDEKGYIADGYKPAITDHLYRRGVLDAEARPDGRVRFRAAVVDARLESFIVLEKAYWLSCPEDVRQAIADRYIMNPDIWIPRYISGGHAETILPVEECVRLLEDSDGCYDLAQCNCNNYRMGCDADKSDVCLSFAANRPGLNTPAHRGLTRRATKEEAIAVLMSADSRGLAHTYNAAHGHICNCCPCCCIHHSKTEKYRKAIRESYMRTPYIITARADLCRRCGRCAARCPFGVLSVGDDGVEIAHDECWGCGVCRRACPFGALRITRRY